MRRRDRNAHLHRQLADADAQLAAQAAELHRLRTELRGVHHLAQTYRAQLEQAQREADNLRGPALAREAAHAALQPRWAR